jgi:serine protease Do
MKKILGIGISVAVIVVLGFGVGASQIGHFFLRVGSSEAVAEKAAPVADNLKDLFVELSRRSVPSVVNIYTTQKVQNPWGSNPQGDLYRRFFEQFFGDNFMPNLPQGPQGSPPTSRRANSLGTGFIIDAKEGLLLTNYHVIADADEIKIVLTEQDREEDGIEAKVVGGDSEADVALLKIKTDRKLQAIPLGDSDSLQVGEWVMAVGNPFGHGHTVTKGIISAKERALGNMTQFSNFLQTDTPINPGNSGGPLINTSGEVIGINTAINAYAQGIGFAIPVNYVKKILPDLRTRGAVTRGFIGVNISELTPQIAKAPGLKIPEGTKGVLVSEVFEGEPAAKAGIRAFDIITEVNGRKIRDGRQLISTVSSINPGTSVSVKIIREGKEKDVKLVVGRRPSRDAVVNRKGEDRSRPVRPSINLGMSVEELDAELRRELGLPANAQGVVVSRVTPGGPADEAGLERGDLITEVDQKPTASVRSFNGAFKEPRVYLLRFRRGEGLAITSLDLTKKVGSEQEEEE